MKSGGYGSYRGRSPLRKILKAVIILLAAVLAVAVIALVFLQQYIVYSSDGVRLKLPFFQNGTTTGTPNPAETEPMVVLTPEVIEPSWLHAVSLPPEVLYDATARQRAKEAGGNAAVFDMKGDNGSLGYVSQLPLAVSAKVSSGDPAVNDAIRALNAEDLYTIARVSCFKDNNLSNADRSLAIATNSGYRWTDPDGVRWVSPTSETVRQYVTGVCVELAELGFDEILLVNAGYPAEGNLSYIKKGAAYDKAAFGTVVNGFYAQVAKALEGYDVKLSILTDGATVTGGGNALSGQTVDSLTAYADRVWLSDADAAAAQILTEAGLTGGMENVVQITAEPGEAASSWAVLTVPS